MLVYAQKARPKPGLSLLQIRSQLLPTAMTVVMLVPAATMTGLGLCFRRDCAYEDHSSKQSE
jgi:hypothetical protein